MTTFDSIPPDIFAGLSGFEGAEKKIEIEFKRPSNIAPADASCGLRSIPESNWQTLLDLIKCQIVSTTKTEAFDSYVLSESSLFVYPYKVILKTCGTTTLLRCLQPMLTLAQEMCQLEPDFFFFARKNFMFPDKQLSPHTSFDEEVELLNKVFDGQAYVMGPRNGEHWYLYICDMKDRDHVGEDQTLEIMMTELDETVMQQFYKNENFVSSKETTIKSGISDFIPGAMTDEIMFDPCGYSVNGMFGEAYFTIHITPEPHCSFVSFETNLALENYNELIGKVVSVFKPNKFSVTLFADANALSGPSTFNGYDHKYFDRLGYGLKYKSFTDFDGSYDLNLCHFHKRA